jgi:hypothetical protein
MDNAASGTAQKALKLNLDAITYGTFAEIGAGQEVARWFFSVGGAYPIRELDGIRGAAPRHCQDNGHIEEAMAD